MKITHKARTTVFSKLIQRNECKLSCVYGNLKSVCKVIVIIKQQNGVQEHIN